MTKSVKNLITFFEELNHTRRVSLEEDSDVACTVLGSQLSSKLVGESSQVEPPDPSLPAREALADEPTGLLAEGPGVSPGQMSPGEGAPGGEPAVATTVSPSMASVQNKDEVIKQIGIDLSTTAQCLDAEYEKLEALPSTLLGSTLETSDNPFAVLEDEVEDGCALRKRLGKKAKTLVKWFEQFGLPSVGSPPPEINCGSLRSAVRQCFSDVSPVWELSFKTVQKLEKSCCKACEPLFAEKLTKWKEDRLRPVAVDMDHLADFRSAFSANIEKGWDRFRRPFIPNGNATRAFTRLEGGNWNREEFSDECRVELVFSSGKPRVVTLYSAENTRILAPLHYSLYECLKRRGWLLVGDPTDEHVQSLNGAKFLSFDYESATDNIKSAYVRVAIDELKKKGTLTSEEELALDVLGNLKIDGSIGESGQPMGSVMSFPLLCLINKTVVDLALNRLLLGGSISFKEWSAHRLLVNGDDLLVREPRTGTDLRSHISREGAQVGLKVNESKTMASESQCEINSTLFVDGKKVRKFNASAIYMDSGVEDVLGFAAEATSDLRTFRRVVRANAHILAKQSDKHLDEIPSSLLVVCRKDKKIRRAITSLPADVRPNEEGVIKMAPEPDGFDLSRDEAFRAMVEEIDRVRERGIARNAWLKERGKFRTSVVPNAQSYSSVLKKKRICGQDLVPACYVRAFFNKIKDALVLEEVASLLPETLPPGDGSKVSVILDNIRAFKMRRNADLSSGTYEPPGDYVCLDC